MFVRFMQYELMRIPAWLKILVILLLTSLVFSALNAAAGTFILTLFLIALILFPGPDAQNPRLVRWIPWIWGLNFFAAIAFLVAGFMGKSLVGPEANAPTVGELWATVVFAPLLIATLLKQHALFKPLLIASTVLFLGLEAKEYSDSLQDGKALLALVGEGSAGIVLTAYLLVKTRENRA